MDKKAHILATNTETNEEVYRGTIEDYSHLLQALTREWKNALYDLHHCFTSRKVNDLVNDLAAPFLSLRFQFVVQKAVNFDTFTALYFCNDINPMTAIRALKANSQTKEEIYQGKLQDCPHLVEALSSPWRVVLFDLDRSFAETNSAKIVDFEGHPFHHLPFFSDLLFSDWAKKPLRTETVNKFLDRNREKRVLEWLEHMDAPIYHRLTKEDRVALRKDVFQRIEHPRYSIQENPEKSMDAIGDLFAEDLSLQSEFWQSLQKLSNYPIDLALETNSKERHRLAKSLFPRVTAYQYNAYLERLLQRRTYVDRFTELAKGVHPAKKNAFLQTLIHESAMPLSQTERAYYLKLLQSGKEAECEKQLLVALSPSYLNFMKSMYPLCGDAICLATAIYLCTKNPPRPLPRMMIYSLERMITDYIQTLPQEPLKDIQKILQEQKWEEILKALSEISANHLGSERLSLLILLKYIINHHKINLN